MDVAFFTESAEGHKGWVSTVDVTSRVSRLFLFKTLDSGVTTEALVDWCRDKNAPEIVFTDGDSKFLGSFSEMCEHLKIRHEVGTAYHHLGQAHAESHIGRVKAALTRMIPPGKLDLWHRYIIPVEHAINNMTRASLGGLTPMEYATGIPRPLLRIDKDSGHELRAPGTHAEHMELIESFRDLADLSSEVAKMRAAAYHNSRHELPEYKVGDLVLVFDPSDKRQISSVYSSPYDGPFIITEVELAEATSISPGGFPTGYYTATFLLPGHSEEHPKLSDKVVYCQADRLRPLGRTAPASEYAVNILPTGTHLLEGILGHFYKPDETEPSFLCKWWHFEEPSSAPLSGFIDLATGRVSNNILRRYCDEHGLDDYGRLMKSTVARPKR